LRASQGDQNGSSISTAATPTEYWGSVTGEQPIRMTASYIHPDVTPLHVETASQPAQTVIVEISDGMS
jgi:hypothetical protein